MDAGGQASCSTWEKPTKTLEITLILLTDEYQPVFHSAEHTTLISATASVPEMSCRSLLSLPAQILP